MILIKANEIDLSNITLTPDADRSNRGVSLGTRADEVDVTMIAAASQHLELFTVNLNFIGSAPTSTSTVNIHYMNLTHDTTDFTDYFRLKGCDWTININKDLQDAYVFQGEIIFGSGTNTIGGEAAVLGLSLNSGTGSLTGNRWVAVFVTTGSAGQTASLFLSHRGGTLTHSLYIECNSSQTITDAIYLNAAGTITNVINIAGVANVAIFLKVNAEAGFVENFSSAGSGIASLKCDIATVDGWIHVYDAP